MATEKRLVYTSKVLEKADEVTFMGFRAEERKQHFMDLVSEILKLPTVDAVEVVHGRWKFLNDYQSRCSECHEVMWVDHNAEPNYCPNCGAKMDGDGNG